MDGTIAGTEALQTAHVKLIVDIMYHAIKDARASSTSDDCFADDDHRSLCKNVFGYGTGINELRGFLESDWFVRLCEELDQVTAEEIREEIIKYTCADG
jgi:hypothetical protein